MYVVRPDIPEDELSSVMQRAADTLTQSGATIELNEVWDRRELAYEIEGVKRGTYCLMYFEAEGSVVEVLRRELELDEQVLRAGVFVANRDAMWRPQPPEPPKEAPEPGTEDKQPEEPEAGTAPEPAQAAATEEAQPSGEAEPSEEGEATEAEESQE